MYVCICNAITEQQIRELAQTGRADLGTLQMELGVAAGCGTCMDTALELLRDLNQSAPHRAYPRPQVYRPQPA